MAANDDIAQNAAAEIRDFHVFLVGWMTGMLTRDAESFTRCTDVLDPEFNIVGPTGLITPRDNLLVNLEAAHGARADAAAPFAIRIERIQPRRIWDDNALMAYEEWQDMPAGTTARQSTVLFGRAPSTPHGLRWLHLHETWIEGHAPTA